MEYPDDDWDYMREARRYRRPSPPRRFVTDTRRSQQFLDPNLYDGGGLTRTRSQGARPNPIIINNEFIQDNYQRSPPYIAYPPSPDMRGRNRLGDELADDLVELALDRRRSRSRGRSDAAWGDRRDDILEAELRRKERQLAEMERKLSNEDHNQLMKQQWEFQKARDEAKWKLEAEEEKEKRKRIERDYEMRRKEEEDDRKEEEKRIRDKIKQEEIDKKAKEEKEWEEFMAKLKAKEEKKKEDEKKKQEELDEAFRTRLLNMGYSKVYVDRMIEEEKIKRTTSTALVPAGGRLGAPTYVKVHREYLSVDTLRYFNLPWEYDKKDKNYIIILREMDKSETEILFEHTKSLRQGKLLLEAPKKQPQYAWVRKRDRSTSRVKKLSIVKFEDE